MERNVIKANTILLLSLIKKELYRDLFTTALKTQMEEMEEELKHRSLLTEKRE